jgi:malonate decarboxylase delta subunit
MEHITLELKAEQPDAGFSKKYTLTGVVSSGNLEVLMENRELDGKCRFEIDTAAEGFNKTWEAVINDFMDRRQPADLLVSINDYAASPDVVSLRLDQAYEDLKGGEK